MNFYVMKPNVMKCNEKEIALLKSICKTYIGKPICVRVSNVNFNEILYLKLVSQLS